MQKNTSKYDFSEVYCHIKIKLVQKHQEKHVSNILTHCAYRIVEFSIKILLDYSDKWESWPNTDSPHLSW